MRHKHLIIIGCASLLLALSTVPTEAQHRRGGRGGGPVIVRSPLLFSGYYNPYYLGFGQWYPYPYPGFGFPPGPGFYPGDRFSSIRLQVAQREALVYVDGYAAGLVDDYDGVFQRLQLVPGHHEIVVYLQGYRTLRENLYLNPGSTHSIKHTLMPLAPGEPAEPQPVPRAMPPVSGAVPGNAPAPEPARTGTLALRVQPGDASVFVDGEPWRGPQGQDRLVIELNEGMHRVRVEKPGFQSFVVDVDVRAGETLTSFNRSSILTSSIVEWHIIPRCELSASPFTDARFARRLRALRFLPADVPDLRALGAGNRLPAGPHPSHEDAARRPGDQQRQLHPAHRHLPRMHGVRHGLPVWRPVRLAARSGASASGAGSEPRRRGSSIPAC